MADHSDLDEFVAETMAWHFGPETGSPFWLRRAETLGFDPRREVRSYADLRMFPNVTDELRDVPVEDLIPQGFGEAPDIVSIIESGGTTGSPKRLPLLREFADTMAAAEADWLVGLSSPRQTGWLAVFPSGPHGALDQMRRTAARYGSRLPVFAIDLDPRWAKRQAELQHGEVVEAYLDHVVGQAVSILEGQNVSMLRVTPPILSRMVRDDHVVDLIQQKIRHIVWGGAHMDAESRYFYRTELFPDTRLTGRYGTTMALGGGLVERSELGPDDDCIMDPALGPFVSVQVVDADTGTRVDVGERGQVVFHLLSRSFLLPNNAERDTAIRHPSPEGAVGDSVADVEPLATFGGVGVVEGVY
ncbi:MAG TPA: AMP-binding protein [Pseudolysinimonas sp.]